MLGTMTAVGVYYPAKFTKDLRPLDEEAAARLGKVSCATRCICWARAGDRVYVRRKDEDIKGGRRWLVIAVCGRAVMMDDATVAEYLRADRDAAGRPVTVQGGEAAQWFHRVLYELKPRSEW